MNTTFYLSALLLGFLGSFHCAGMCGPIALMLRGNSGTKPEIITRLIYNSGRVIAYVSIGLLFGLMGFAVSLKGLQRELSIVTGIIILLIIFLESRGKRFSNKFFSSDPIANFIRKKLKFFFQRKSNFSFFMIGFLNGFLPCGFVYMAIAGATTSGSAAGGMLYMSLFGLGTFPVMLSIAAVADYFGINFRKQFTKTVMYFTIGLGIFLIYRGAMMSTSDCSAENKGPHVTKNCYVTSTLLK